MSDLLRELRDLITSGPLAHLSTVDADGSPQVIVIWIGLDGDELVSGHMRRNLKVRNIERDPRVALSFDALREPGVFFAPRVPGAEGSRLCRPLLRGAHRRRRPVGVADPLTASLNLSR